nr:immunoglobulin heavy chain junction region [Mus musculus]
CARYGYDGPWFAYW